MSNETPKDLYTDYRDLWQSPEQQFRELVAQTDQGWAEATATEESEAMAVFSTPEPSINYAALWKQPNTGLGEGIAGITAGEGSLAENPSINFKIRERDDDSPRRFAAGDFVIPKDGGVVT